MKTIILVSGFARSGKDYTASLIKKIVGDAEIMSFAEPMKQILCDTFQITKAELNEYKNESSRYSLCIEDEYWEGLSDKQTDFREVLQRFGTEAMKKQFGDNVWTDLLAHKAKVSQAEVIVVSDWRFIEECRGLYKYFINDDVKIITVRVNTKQGVNLMTAHRSEVDLLDFPFEYNIDNSDKCPLKLEAQIKSILKGEDVKW